MVSDPLVGPFISVSAVEWCNPTRYRNSFVLSPLAATAHRVENEPDSRLILPCGKFSRE
jgi:hypothetical protein